ncbi:uncharacterized protein SOCE26_064560 [Sorangium cellulosum]|uniref:Uncharacterized protein n=1 Tax=Sorangium cellulosum TaxID=56 RepID=A0A2L0F0C7_SORCE|nr:uncharacterized protein SOCE26_064560 [Sorangium cellulosum]
MSTPFAIAIVGVGLRSPAGVTTLERLWTALATGERA